MHAVSQQKERQPMQYRGTQRGKGQKCKPGKEKGEKLYTSKHFAGRKRGRMRTRLPRMQHRQCLWQTAHRCSWPPIGRTSFFVKTPPPAFCSTTITSRDGEKRREGARERAGKCGFRLPEHAIATCSFIYPAKHRDSIQSWSSFIFSEST